VYNAGNSLKAVLSQTLITNHGIISLSNMLSAVYVDYSNLFWHRVTDGRQSETPFQEKSPAVRPGFRVLEWNAD